MCLAIHSNPEVQNILPHLYGIIFLFLYSSIEYLTSGKFTVYLRFKIFVLHIRNILFSRKLRLVLQTLSLKFSFSVFLFFNISFESEFGNPRFETLEKQNVFNFQLTCFSAIVNFILWFCTSLSRETCSFELVSQLFLFFAHQQKKVFKPSFSKLGF